MAGQMGNIIKMARQNKNMTQEELAGRLSITAQAISKWERNVSTPDIGILEELCRTLEISADFLLGIDTVSEADNAHSEENRLIFEELRRCFEPLELYIGEGLIHLFLDRTYVELIRKMRRNLASEGILVPLVHIKDMALKPTEFMVLSYEKVLYDEVSEISEKTDIHYIMGKLEAAIRSGYTYIISPDITKMLVDNLKMDFPALIEGVVPERISYHVLTEILREFIKKGNSPKYLKKVIEIAERELRKNPDSTVEKIAETAEKEIADNNVWVLLTERRG